MLRRIVLDASNSTQRPVTGSCVNCNEASSVVEGGEFRGQLGDCQILTVDSAAFSCR